LSDVHIQLAWQIERKAEDLLMTQPQVLNLGRIIREAVSNVIRHAQASQVTVNLSSSDKHLSLTVSDNGIGLPTESASTKGRGLHNIQKRATLLGGEVHFTALTTGGLKLCLQLPLHVFAQATH
jgi:signal transduction histidine kinase